MYLLTQSISNLATKFAPWPVPQLPAISLYRSAIPMLLQGRTTDHPRHTVHPTTAIGVGTRNRNNTMRAKTPITEIEICIPDELQYLLAEAAEDLEITTDELVRQAISSYCREQQGGRHD